MANNTEKNVPAADKRIKLLAIACGVLVLALIVVSAFAYEWHTTMVEQKDTIMDLRAISDTTTISSMSEEIANLTMVNNILQSENDEYVKTIAEYEAILEENNLLPQ